MVGRVCDSRDSTMEFHCGHDNQLLHLGYDRGYLSLHVG